MTRAASSLSLLAALLLGACATAEAPRSLRSATAGAGDDNALRAQCTAEAERAINFRNRGQSAREDQAMFTTDQTNNIPSLRVQADQFNRRVEREELIRDCIRANTAGPQPQDPAPRGRRS